MSFLQEAVLMAEYCDERPGQTMAGLEFLDAHQYYRLTLDSLTQSRSGRLFEEQENYTGGDSLPVHLRKERSFYLRKTKDFSGVQALLEAMSRVFGVPGHTSSVGLRVARRSFMKRCVVPEDGSDLLGAMADYFINLADALPELDVDDGVVNLGDREVGVKDLDFSQDLPTYHNYTMYLNTRVPQGDEEFVACGATTRQVLVHAPNADIEKDWIERQGVTFQSFFLSMRKCKDLETFGKFHAIIREKSEQKVWRGKQLRVLWGMYFTLRSTKRMGKCATRLANSIKRQNDASKIGRVGACLYAWSQGDSFCGKRLPGEISVIEWAVIWDLYRAKKEELCQ